MSKEEKRTYILAVIASFIPVLAGIVLYKQLPDVIATHWDAQGVANGFQNKFVGAIVFPGILTVLTLIMPLLMRIDPKYKNMNDKLKTLVIWIIPVISIVCAGVTLGSGMGYDMPVATIVCSLLGVVFVLSGNYLPKTGQSYTMGIKLPWTLNSEENWNKTHRMAGFLWVIGGFITLIGAFTPWRAWVIIICVIIMVLAPTIYSYCYYKKHEC